MNWKSEIRILFWIIFFLVFAFFMPLEQVGFRNAVIASLDLLRWYAQEHVVLCLIPAFFIAGVIAVFFNQSAIIKYFGASAKKWLSYSIASVSGAVLAVCSCTILPLFSSIHKKGAGIGPAVAFLYSGPAINILAIILTARVLGWEIGIARIIGAVIFAIVIGLVMGFIYRKEDKAKAEEQMKFSDSEGGISFKYSFMFLLVLILIMVFSTVSEPANGAYKGLLEFLWTNKWTITALLGVLMAYLLINVLRVNWNWVAAASVPVIISSWIAPDPLITFIVAIVAFVILTLLHGNESKEWTLSTWDFAKQIIPLLAIGIIIAGFLFGSEHGDTFIPGIIPDNWVGNFVGGNSLSANLFASVIGAFMYFATLTEIPILQGLLSLGMGKGPALALLLAGPSLSLPNMLVIRSVLGTEKTVVYSLLVIIMATLCGLIFGAIS